MCEPSKPLGCNRAMKGQPFSLMKLEVPWLVAATHLASRSVSARSKQCGFEVVPLPVFVVKCVLSVRTPRGTPLTLCVPSKGPAYGRRGVGFNMHRRWLGTRNTQLLCPNQLEHCWCGDLVLHAALDLLERLRVPTAQFRTCSGVRLHPTPHRPRKPRSDIGDIRFFMISRFSTFAIFRFSARAHVFQKPWSHDGAQCGEICISDTDTCDFSENQLSKLTKTL